jgi:hypothetical protein
MNDWQLFLMGSSSHFIVGAFFTSIIFCFFLRWNYKKYLKRYSSLDESLKVKKREIEEMQTTITLQYEELRVLNRKVNILEQ